MVVCQSQFHAVLVLDKKFFVSAHTFDGLAHTKWRTNNSKSSKNKEIFSRYSVINIISRCRKLGQSKQIDDLVAHVASAEGSAQNNRQYGWFCFVKLKT